jgi:hypothetical protein
MQNCDTPFDVNNQKVAALMLVTNEYGSLPWKLNLPEGLLNEVSFI